MILPARGSGAAGVLATVLALVTLLLLPVSPAAAAAGAQGTAPEPGQAAPAPRVSLPELEDEVMCPICKTLLSLSASPAAQRERAFIRRLIAAGKSKEEIKQALVAEYGGQVLAVPEREGVNLWAWVIPTLLLAVAVLGVGWWLLRRRRDDAGGGAATGPGQDAPATGDEERLERDMARFDL